MVTPRGAELPSCCAAFGDGGLVGLAIFGRDVVWLMLGSQWMPMVGPLIWLCFLGWFRTLTQTFDFLNIAIGKPETEAKLRAVELVLFVAGIIPAIRWYGASGTAAYLFLIYVISFLLHVWATHPYVRGVSQAVVTVWVSFAPLYRRPGSLWMVPVAPEWPQHLARGHFAGKPVRPFCASLSLVERARTVGHHHGTGLPGAGWMRSRSAWWFCRFRKRPLTARQGGMIAFLTD